MKKVVFIALAASLSLTACVKNEPAPLGTAQNEITFSTPVVGLATKALVNGMIDGTTYPTDQTFNVWGWYCGISTNVFDADDASAYMTDVTVAYDQTELNGDETESGAWRTNPTYYWPKNGTLTFDAYSPTELQINAAGIYGDGCSVSCDPATGLTIANYQVPQIMGDQIDILYSSRAYDKTKSSFTSGNDYEGVDIQFNHALSAIQFKVSTDKDYPAGTVTLKAINIGAYGRGTFTQNIADDRTSAPKWDLGSYTDGYTVFYKGDYAASTNLTSTPTAFGTPALLLPQEFVKEDQEIEIVYYIKNASETPAIQVTTFELTEQANWDGVEEGTPVTVDKWEMGKRYTYNIVIGLDEIYFAPTVTDWVDVEVTLPQI